MPPQQSRKLPDFNQEVRDAGLEDIAASLGDYVPSRVEENLSLFISNCPEVLLIKKKIKKLCNADIPVLITGETGVGKELLARALHSNKPGDFVGVNCGGIPDTLLESEFFGARRGAYTGCDSDRLGLLQQANKGTLFLDEIGEMPGLLQCKLLRCLQEKTYRAVGGLNTQILTARIVSATNRSVEELTSGKIFRRDLFYRLAGVVINIPPLRNRLGDAELLWQKHGMKGTLSENASLFREGLNFPGNVRELLNKIEELKILGEL